MSDELKIELQVETDDSKARSQLDDLIKEYKNKKPIEVDFRLGNTNLDEFQANIKSITSSLESLSKIDFKNLKSIESNLKNISKVASEYQDTLAKTTAKKSNSSGSSSILDILPDFEDEKIERLSKNQKEALEEVKSLKYYAERIEQEYDEYRQLIKNSYKKSREDNSEYFSKLNEYETMFDTKHYEKLIGYYKELDNVISKYNSLGVNLVQVDKITNEKYDGTMGYRRYQEYVDSMGLSNKKFEELVVRAKDLNAIKNGLLTNLKRNLKKASEDEKVAFEIFKNLYKDMPEPDLTDANSFKGYLSSFMKGIFEFDFEDLDLRFEEDFERMYERFFKLVDEVKDEYNKKFKDLDGLEGFDIFNAETLKEETEKLDKEIIDTADSITKLKDLSSDTLKNLGLNDNSIDVFKNLTKSVEELELKLGSFKDKFANTFEVSSDSYKSLEKIKDALSEINKLTDDQKQMFFDFGLDVDNIKKAKEETKDLEESAENLNDISFSGLIQSYSRLESATGKILSEQEKIRTSALSTVSLNYRYEEDPETGEMVKKLSTARYSEEISKRTSQLLKDYSKASSDLAKAQKEYYEALNGGKSSETTINKLSENVKTMEDNLSKVRKSVSELDQYSDVVDDVLDTFNKIDTARHNQMEKDALKIVDRADLEQANKILKETKSLIDNISKNSVQLQKDVNAGYSETAEGLEARIKQQEQQVTKNLSKLMNISNSKAAIDQIFSYQLNKAQQTQIEIARINDKANKTTGTKIVDEQDQYLKEYKRYLTELKAIQKSLTKESNETARAGKIIQLDNTFKELERIKSLLNEVKSEAAQGLFDQTMRELDLHLASSFSKTTSELDKVEEKINKLSKSEYVNSEAVSSAETVIRNLRNTLEKGLDGLNTKDLSGILVEIEKLKKSAKDIEVDIKLARDNEKIENFTKSVTDRLEALQRAANNVDVSHITRQLNDLAAGSDRNSVVMKRITDDLNTLERRLKSAGNVGLNFRGFFDELGQSLRTFTLGDIIGDVITDSLYQATTVIKDMDAAMSNLKKVADLSDVNTEDKLNSIKDAAISVAKEVGMSSADTINAIASTLQAGIGSMEESIQVARSAMILANVGDMTQDAASESLNTIINSFNIKPLNEIDVQVGSLTQKTTELANAMDLLNYAGNNYAIGADGVAEAMKRGGTVLSQYGVSIQDTVGLITAANEAIQDPAKVGNALKSIAINMSGVKANASKGTMELNKTAKALKEIAGIEVYSDKSKGEIKDMVTILDELNVKLKEGKLNQDEFRAVSEALAGKEQAAVLQSLLGNYETFKQIQDEFSQGLHFGSAEKENAAYVDSIAGKLNELKEVWIDTLTALADSETVKGFLDVFIDISEGINVFIKALDSVGLAFPVLLGSISGGTSFFKTLWSSLDAASEAGDTLGLSFTGIGNTIKKGVLPAITNFAKQGALIGGVTLAVQACAWGWDKLTNGVKNTAKELQSVEDDQLSNITAQSQKIKALETTGVKYEELANKAKRTAEEEEELLRLGNELAQILPEMVIGYDEENNAILHMTDDMEGLIEKAKEANDQYNRLLLGTRIEQSDSALKLLTKGEIFGEDAKGLNDQKIELEKSYNKTMKDLQNDYILQLENVRNLEGKNREKALQNARDIRNQMIVEESKYMTEYSSIQSRIVEQANIFRDEMDSTWRDSSVYLIEELTPELEKSIEKFTNSMDFTEINSEEELESVRRIFRELPKLAQSGAVDIEKLSSQISDINKEFSKTGNLEEYKNNMKALAKSLSDETGWDATALEEMFTMVTDGTLQGSTSLETFLSNYNKTVNDIRNGDSIAKALHEQYNAIETALNSINHHDFGSNVGNYQLRLNLQTDENIPKQVREAIDKMVKIGLDDTEVITVTGEILMSLKDGKIDEGETALLREQLRNTLQDRLSGEELELTINGILKSFNSDEILKSIEDELGDKKVEKEVSIKADDPKGIEEINKAIKLLESRPDVNKAVRAVVEGDEDLVFFAEIIRNLPVNETFTNKFIVENAKALSELKSYQEVLDYINSLPDDVKKTYNIKAEGLTETAENIEEIDTTINSVNEKELKVQSSNDDVLKTIDDVKALIEISSKVEEGKYKIEIDANTQAAIDNINLLKDSVNSLNGELGKGKKVTYHAETAQPAKNIKGLIDRVNQIKKLTGKTFKYYANTAQAAKNIKGLIDRVNQIKRLSGKTFNYYANTAQAAKNIKGLIDRIDQINSRKSSKSFSYTTTVKQQTVAETDTSIAIPDTVSNSISPVSTVADEIAGQTSRIQASLRTGIGEINNFSSNMARATLKTPIAITGTDIHNSIKYSVNLLQELENRINSVSNSLATLDKKMESAVGKDKIQYLQQQNTLYQEQLNLQKELEDKLVRQKNYYKYYLEKNGFKFNADGNLTNYEEKLLAMEKEAERLNGLAETANNKYNDYTGDNEKTKNSLKSAYETAKKKADAYAGSLSEIQKFLEEYINVTFTELPKVQEEWESISNSIKENENAIKNLRREQELYTKNTKLRELDMLLDEINDKQDLLNEKISSTKGNDDKVKYQKEYLDLLNEEIKIQEERVKQYENSLSVFQNELSGFGFNFDTSGTIKNLDEILNKYQSSKDLEYLNNLLEEYFAIQRDNLPDAKKDWQSLKNEIDNTTTSINNLKQEIADLHIDSGYKDHNRDLAEVENELALAQIKYENSTGKNKIEYLEQVIKLTQNLKRETQDLLSYESSRRNSLMSELGQYGFSFRNDGSIAGYGSIIAQLKETLSDDEFEQVYSKIEEYLDITYEKIPDLEQSLEELGYSVEDYNDELDKLLRQRQLEAHTNKVQELNNEYDKLADTLDIIDIKLKHAVGSEKLNLLKQQIELLEQQKQLQVELMEKYQSMANIYQGKLIHYGVKFDDNGDISNLDEVLNEYQDHKDLEKLKELIEEYLDIQRDQIPEIEKEWESLNAAIKDAYKEQLNVTQDMEEKITSMYKKQIEERIDAMNKETDAKIKALKKQQDAYNKYRDEVEYKNEYNEKLEEINKLQNQLDIAMRDTSLNGQQKVKELQNLLAQAQKELNEITQDKIDSDVNDLYDKEAERIEEENQNAIDKLEEEWSDSKIAQMVADALGSGVFTDIEGNVHDLEDALINFADETGELFGVMGSVIKSELITNLEIARDTVLELEKVLKELDLSEYANTTSSLSIDTAKGHTIEEVSTQVVFESSLINVEGNVDANVVEDLKAYGEQLTKDIIDKIYSSIR